jgi:hypothetical protein
MDSGAQVRDGIIAQTQDRLRHRLPTHRAMLTLPPISGDHAVVADDDMALASRFPPRHQHQRPQEFRGPASRHVI